MSVARAVVPDVQDVAAIFRLLALLERLRAHREDLVRGHARRFRLRALPLVWGMAWGVTYVVARASGWSVGTMTNAGLLAFVVLGVSIGMFALGSIPFVLAHMYSPDLRAELAAIERDRARLIALINEARVAMANDLTEYQRVELDIRLRRLAGP